MASGPHASRSARWDVEWWGVRRSAVTSVKSASMSMFDLEMSEMTEHQVDVPDVLVSPQAVCYILLMTLFLRDESNEYF